MLSLRHSLRRSTFIRSVQSRTFAAVIELDDLDTVEKFKTSNDKAILYFTATWCGPCRQVKPAYKEMSEKYDKVSFGQVDVDVNSESAAQESITSVPTFMSYSGGKLVSQFSGADTSQLAKMAEDLSQS